MTDSIVGTRNAQIYNPRNIEELQYSLPAQMALAVLGKGNGYRAHRDFMEGRIDLSPGSEALEMTRRMKLAVNKELDGKYPYFVADVTVHFKDGTTEHCFTERAKGSPMKPYTPARASSQAGRTDRGSHRQGSGRPHLRAGGRDEGRPSGQRSDAPALPVKYAAALTGD